MKKILFVIALAFTTVASAQVHVKGSKFFDNWSMGVEGGVTSNLHDWDAPNGAVTGLELVKGITPVYSIEFASQIGVNNNNNWNVLRSANAIDNVTAIASAKVNLMRLFSLYEASRFFEIEARAGVGYMRSFYPSYTQKDLNCGVAKLGADFNFNLGKLHEWTVSVRPAVVLRTQNGISACDNASACLRYSHNAVGQITAAAVYHFKTSNGNHYFSRIVRSKEKTFDQRELLALVSQEKAELNREIARLNNELGEREKQVNRLQMQMRAMQEQMNSASKPVDTRSESPMDNGQGNDEFRVYFPFSESSIADEQIETVKRVATYLKQNKKATIAVNGYASEEGDERFNEYLAKQRALSVKKMLVDNYGIDARRIKAVGKGVSTSFGAPEWNRVSICVVKK